MGLLKRARQKRRDRKLAEKIAKRQAKSRAKDEKKLNAKKEKYLNKTAKKVMKQDAKDRKDQRKHEKDLAKSAVQQIRARGFSPAKAVKFASAIRIAAPVVIPLIYRAVNGIEGRGVATKAKKLGLSTQELSRFRGDGGPLKARIENIRDQAKNTPSGFAKDVNQRLTLLLNNIESAEKMPKQQRDRALSKASGELDAMQSEIHRKITR
ncbi:DUF6474 family protein [Corynebacterium kroppenstedtii]|uniref:DUF6474 family protein n=1 Tax=Corynebacterium sp. PCR 32 TaxID=3351342 RepID=UPI00309D00D7